MEIFAANTQYNDYKGSSSADDNDAFTMKVFLTKKKLIAKNEIVVGVSLYSGEVHKKTQKNKVYVTFKVAPSTWGSNYDLIREIEMEISLAQFFGFFKRFAITVSQYNSLGNNSSGILEKRGDE